MEIKKTKPKKKTFLLYYDQSQIWEGLSDKQAGILIKLLHKKTPPNNSDPLIKYAYKIIEKKIDNDYSKWLKRCEHGKRGASVKWGDLDENNDKKRSERLSIARKKAKHTKEEWEAMLSLFDCCPRCGGNSVPVKDHIIPIYKGGSDGIDNLQPLCKKCNSQKGPEEKDFRPDNWKELLNKYLQMPGSVL